MNSQQRRKIKRKAKRISNVTKIFADAIMPFVAEHIKDVISRPSFASVIMPKNFISHDEEISNRLLKIKEDREKNEQPTTP